MQNLNHYQDFSDYLKAVYSQRCQTNPRYSLRAFAKTLGIHPSPLSQILRGKRGMSEAMILRLGKKLGHSTKAIEEFLSRRNESDIPYNELAIDMFHLISEWYHLALLELMSLENFKPEPRWIAKALGLTVNEVHISIERLKNLKMLEVKEGRWRDLTGGRTTTGKSDFTNEALKHYQKCILDKAKEALEFVSIEDRDQTGTTFTLEKKDLPLAKEKIQRFRRKLARDLKTDNPEEVYHLSVSLFPLSKAKELSRE